MATALAATLVTAATACGPGPDSWEQVEQRLLSPDDPQTPLTPHRCTLGGASRQAVGCLGWLDASGREVSRNLELGIIGFPLRAGEAREHFVVDRRYRSPDGTWKTLPALLWRGRAGRMQVPLPAPEDAEIRVRLRPVPPRERSFETAPLAVSEQTTVVGELGLQTPLPARGAPVTFRIDAESEAGTSTLLERTIDPTRQGDRWLAYQLDVGAFAGEKIVLEFASEPTADATEREGRSFATWSRPRVLAADQPAPGTIRDVLVVSFDTLRADNLGSYGSPRPTTPNLDAFAREAVLFESAQSAFPSTTASHMSILTGLYPRVHGVLRPVLTLNPRVPTLAQMLAEAGFATAAFTEDGMITEAAGFYRGIDVYREFRSTGSRTRTTGHVEEVFEAGLGWLSRHPDERTFMFLHTYQVHGPYEPPKAFDRFGSDEPGIDARERARRAYAGEVRYADFAFGRLLEGLERLGRLDRMAIIVTSDHGEGFGKHSLGHGTSLYQTELHVPLIIRLPGGPTGRRSAPVSLVDLVPTLVDLLGLSVDAPFQGRSLVPLLESDDAPGFAERAVFSERGVDGQVVAVRRGDRKWIVGGKWGSKRFDLSSDPGERQPAKSERAMAPGVQLVRDYEANARRVRGLLRRPTPTPVEMDPDTEAELRALGYLD